MLNLCPLEREKLQNGVYTIKVSDITNYSNLIGSYTDTASYNGTKGGTVTENSDGTFTIKIPVNSNGYIIRVSYSDFSNTDFTGVTEYITSDDRLAGYKEFTVDSPFFKGYHYEIQVNVDNYVSTYTGTTLYMGNNPVPTLNNGNIRIVIETDTEDIEATYSIGNNMLNLSVSNDYSDVTWKVFNQTYTGNSQSIDVSSIHAGKYNCVVKGKKDGVRYSDSFIFTLVKE